MRMKYAVRHIGEVAVLDLSGHISPGKAIEERRVLHDLVTDQVNRGHTKVLLNLSEVSYVDSSGLGDLLEALRLVQSQGGQLHTCNASQRISNLLSRTHLDSVINCYGSEAAALQAFADQTREKISAV